MKYMLLIYMAEVAMNDSERQQCYKDSTDLTHELNAAGHFLGAGPLQPVTSATCVRVRESRRLVTDGPFAETREQLGGYFLVDVADLDAALAIAARIPAAKKGVVEVRPLIDIPGLPEPTRDSLASAV